MNSHQSNRNDSGPLSEADELAIDSLICEVQKITPSPPDLLDAILLQLARGCWDGPTTGAKQGQDSRSSTAVAAKRLRTWSLAAGLLALAASVVLVFSPWERNAIDATNIAKGKKLEATGGTETNSEKSLVLGSRPSEQKVAQSESNGVTAPVVETAKPARHEGVPLVRSKPLMTTELNVERLASGFDSGPNSEALAANHVEVLAKFNDQIKNYWDHVGVTAATPINDMEWADRIEDRFGARPNLTVDGKLANAMLLTAKDCEPLAVRIVRQLFRNVPLAPDSRERMIAEATETIVLGKRFDELISRWVTDASLFDHKRPELVSQGLATNLLDADASCARCHDSPVDRRFVQDDYWALASVFAPVDRAPMFYELTDGRQRVAESRIPARWLGSETSQQPSSLDSHASSREQLSKRLVGNRNLAQAIANRIWEIGFGAPLVSRASDPIAPPRDDALQKSHTALSDAIIKSNFDIRFAAKLVMASEAMRRGQSELYASGRWRVANDEAIANDSLVQRTFAAALVKRPRVSNDRLLAMMGSRIGQVPRALGASDTVLAQPAIGAESKQIGVAAPEKPRDEEYLWAAWVGDRKQLRDSWLHWIKDPAEQQRHAYYAVNMSPPKSDEDFASLLVSPADEKSVAAENATDRLLWVLRQSL